MNDCSVRLTGASSASAVMRRSARRHTVRHTWHCAASMQPPGRMNECSGSRCASSWSMMLSKCVICFSVMEQGGGVSCCLQGIAKWVPTSKRRDCIHSKKLVLLSAHVCSSISFFIMLPNRPIWALSSSMVPYDSKRRAHFFTLMPPMSDVVPVSPPRVYILLFLSII